jgi:UDP-N-acetylmuramate dehydrogenase
VRSAFDRTSTEMMSWKMVRRKTRRTLPFSVWVDRSRYPQISPNEFLPIRLSWRWPTQLAITFSHVCPTLLLSEMKQLPANLRELLRSQIRGEIFENEPLRNRTTYRIGGPARYLVCPRDLQDLRTLNELIQRHDIPRFILGGGANVLVSDRGFYGIAIHLGNFNQLTFDGCQVAAGAGLILDQFVIACLKRELAGLERLSGIPGTLGGALRMNAGAFDAEISDHLTTVQCMDIEGNYRVLEKSQVSFSYRQAPVIKDTYILAATFHFPAGSAEALFVMREDILARRYERQPWQFASAGSVFKRPPGYYTGKLIEDLGLKGKTIGRAQISPKHAGIIINLDNARAEDVLSLIRLAQQEVRRHYKVELELEQELIGFEESGEV